MGADRSFGLPRLRVAPRIVVAILLTIGAAYLFNQALRAVIPPPPFLVVEREWLIDATVGAARIAQGSPNANADAAFSKLADSEQLEFKIWRTAPPAAKTPSAELAEHLRLSIARKLGDAASRVSVSSAPYDQNYAESTVRTVLVIVPELPALLTAETLASNESSVLGDFNIVIQLSDGRWLTVTQRDLTKPWRHYVRAGFGVAGYLLIAILFSVWMARSIIAPLTHLADAAERLGRSGETTIIKGMRLPEYAAIADTFNTMQLRLRRFIDERVGMLAAISHDLRTPLTRLRLLAEYLEDEGQREQLLSNISEMETMISDALAFMRAEVRRETLETIDVAAILISLTDDFCDLGENIEYDGPNHAQLPARPLALKRAFSNLISNGTKYGGAVRVSLHEKQDAIVIDIHDEGVGIPADQVERAFAPFERLESSRSRETGGSGLGLAITRDIVRSHGGEITCIWPSNGFIMRVSLPIPAQSSRFRAARI